MISSKPDFCTYPLSENEVDYMIFLSTDGIWDCLEEEQIFELVRIFVTEHSIKGLRYEISINLVKFKISICWRTLSLPKQKKLTPSTI